MPTPRKTIAVLIDHVDRPSGGYESQLRHAFDAATRRRDLNLLVVVGRELQGPDPSQAVQNAVYDFMEPGAVDGVILMASSLASFVGVEGVVDLCRKLRRLATCTVGIAVAGVPAVVHDSRPAMEALVEHVVRNHGCRRVAFLGGPPNNPDARVRFAVFCEVLQRHGLRLDRELVCHDEFTAVAGKRAMQELLSRRLAFDAVVAANDCLALGALEALRGARVRVPRDVLVTGFDDLALARLANPQLTTVRQPLDRMAELAVELIVAQLGGRPVPPCVALPGKFVARRSCGCGVKNSAQELPWAREGSEGAAAFVARHEARLVRLLSGDGGLPLTISAHLAERLVQGLRDDLAGEHEAFLSALEQLLEEPGDGSEFSEHLQDALTLLWAELFPVTSFELEALWHEARRVVALADSRAQAQRRWDLEDVYVKLLQMGDRLATVSDYPALRRLLGEELPALAITDTVVALQGDPSRPAALTPFFLLREGQAHDPEPGPGPAAFENVVKTLAKEGRRRAAFVMPLTSETQQLGIAVFEFGPPPTVYDMLREQLSNALRNVSLHAELLQKTLLHERSVQERLAAAERAKSLSVLAGGVAHDLNNALGPLLALPDVIRYELETRSGDGADLSPEIVADLHTIKTAALRASQTIKDLLTLGRQGQTKREPMDLNLAVSASVAAQRVELDPQQASRLRLSLELASAPLVIRGSEAHLERAISNLVRNALDAIDGPGSVSLRTERVRVLETRSGYETIAPGEYAVVIVTDTGKGIPPDALAHMFEPFFSQKRLSGSSGSGLGLAIVHGVVKEHAGFVDVESTPGQGSTFRLYFPCIDAALPVASESRLLPVERARILVVDDDPVQLRTASRVLSRLGYEVVAVDSGAKAVALFEEAMSSPGDRPERTPAPPFDLVIMDMVLREESDGVEVMNCIRTFCRDQKALIATGQALESVWSTGSDPPFAWVCKPYTAETLVRMVERALGRTASMMPPRAPLGTPAKLAASGEPPVG